MDIPPYYFLLETPYIITKTGTREYQGGACYDRILNYYGISPRSLTDIRILV
jgi:hypothetical protein